MGRKGEFHRTPVVGEVVTTPDGSGHVVSVLPYADHTKASDQLFAAAIRSKMGNNFARSYFELDVEIGSDVKTYHCWEVEYDSGRDPESAPWREPEPD